MSDLFSLIVFVIIIFALVNWQNRKNQNSSDRRFFQENDPAPGPDTRYYSNPENTAENDPLRGGRLEWDDRTGQAYISDMGSRSSGYGYQNNAGAGYNGGYNRQKEVTEAISAGERALDSLRDAERKLQSARGWGMVDIVGGGLISGAIKHERISEAQYCIEAAKRELGRFRDELDDIRGLENLRIDVGDFLTFADFFFDGFIADFLVQSKISDARNQVQEAIRRVEDILRRLQQMR